MITLVIHLIKLYNNGYFGNTSNQTIQTMVTLVIHLIKLYNYGYFDNTSNQSLQLWLLW